MRHFLAIGLLASQFVLLGACSKKENSAPESLPPPIRDLADDVKGIWKSECSGMPEGSKNTILIFDGMYLTLQRRFYSTEKCEIQSRPEANGFAQHNRISYFGWYELGSQVPSAIKTGMRVPSQVTFQVATARDYKAIAFKNLLALTTDGEMLIAAISLENEYDLSSPNSSPPVTFPDSMAYPAEASYRRVR